MAPIFKILPYMYIASKISSTLEKEKETKLPVMKIWMVKTVRRFFFFFWFFTMVLWWVSNV